MITSVCGSAASRVSGRPIWLLKLLLRLVGAKVLAQDVVHDLAGRGLADRAGDGHDLERVHPPVRAGEVAQRPDRVRDFQEPLVPPRRPRPPADDGTGRPFAQDLAHVVMAVEFSPAIAKKQSPAGSSANPC
jgi:hypothetical protein